MVTMPPALEADVALLHVAAGEARGAPPPGTLASVAPRRAARGRREDLFFVTVTLQAAQAPSPRLPDQVAQAAAGAFFDTPGSVTGALREAVAEANDHLLDANRDSGLEVEGRLVAAALHGRDLYVAQSGSGQAVLIRQGQVSRLTSAEAAARPLGVSVRPQVRFHHLVLEPDDLVLLTAAPPTTWSDSTLGDLTGLDPAQAVERLAATTDRDLTGLLLRAVPPGQGTTQPQPTAPADVPRPKRARARPAAPAAPSGARARLGGLAERLAPVGQALGRAFAAFVNLFLRGVSRLAPGLAEPPSPSALSPTLLAGTAIAIPILVVAVVSVVYLRRGRSEQFESLLIEAQAAAATAAATQDQAAARAEWARAADLLDQAAAYGTSAEAERLQADVQQALDAIDLVVRLDFRPVISGGFGAGARLTSLAATAGDLYVLDQSGPRVWHVWSTGRGYELDSAFECLESVPAEAGRGRPVDLALQAEPGALGVAGVVVVDSDGGLVYCAPEKEPAVGELEPPDIGFSRIQAVDVAGSRLYVLDPPANAVWLYDASGGVFSGSPTLYFAEDVPDLSDVIDLAVTEDELLLLHTDGALDRCRRQVETLPNGSTRLASHCERRATFQDARPGFEPLDHIPGAIPLEVVYSPPPEPSLFFLDSVAGSVYQYSLRLVYQAQFRPTEPFEGEVTALTVAPPNDLFVAAGDQVYVASALRP